MTHYPCRLAVSGIVVFLLAFTAAAQDAPNRALSLPRTTGADTAKSIPAASLPTMPGAAGNFGWGCSEALAKEKELNALLKERIAVLEQRLALAGGAPK